MTTVDYDFGIIGGGPAGAAVAAYLAKAGAKCLVLERETFPRPHVGESLVPSSTRVFKELDFISTMESAGFPKKYGAAWTTQQDTHEYAVEFAELNASAYVDVKFAERAQEGVDRDYTFHVDRAKFDELLLKHAENLGAEVRQNAFVRSVDFSDKNPTIHFRSHETDSKVRVRMVIDASGRNTILGNQLKLKVKDPVFDQCATHAWFKSFDRNALTEKPERADYIVIHFLPLTNSWLWQIPITEDITSFGVVTPRKNAGTTPEARTKFFWDSVDSLPKLAKLLRSAEQCHAFRHEGDYSYAMTEIAGDGYVLIGDAARFVDPIFSTGVSIALNSARFASRSLLKALTTGEFNKYGMSDYISTIRRGTENWHSFISIYYRLNVLFTYFVSQSEYRLDVLKLLQGDVYDEDRPAVIEQMKSVVREVEENEQHPWHHLLGTLTANEFRPKF